MGTRANVTSSTIRVDRLDDDDTDTASAFRPVLSRNENHLKPGGRLQLPPIEKKSTSKLRTSNSFGNIVGEVERKEKPRLRKSNAIVLDSVPTPKAKELRSLSIAVPPHSLDTVSHLVSPLPTHKQFRHTDSIQRYDDEVTGNLSNDETILILLSHTGGVTIEPISIGGDHRTCEQCFSCGTCNLCVVIGIVWCCTSSSDRIK